MSPGRLAAVIAAALALTSAAQVRDNVTVEAPRGSEVSYREGLGFIKRDFAVE